MLLIYKAESLKGAWTECDSSDWWLLLNTWFIKYLGCDSRGSTPGSFTTMSNVIKERQSFIHSLNWRIWAGVIPRLVLATIPLKLLFLCLSRDSTLRRSISTFCSSTFCNPAVSSSVNSSQERIYYCFPCDDYYLLNFTLVLAFSGITIINWVSELNKMKKSHLHL